MTKEVLFVPYVADVSTFLRRSQFLPKKWFYFVHVTGAIFTY